MSRTPELDHALTAKQQIEGYYPLGANSEQVLIVNVSNNILNQELIEDNEQGNQKTEMRGKEGGSMQKIMA